jgi:hypothetical protein
MAPCGNAVNEASAAVAAPRPGAELDHFGRRILRRARRTVHRTKKGELAVNLDASIDRRLSAMSAEAILKGGRHDSVNERRGADSSLGYQRFLYDGPPPLNLRQNSASMAIALTLSGRSGWSFTKACGSSLYSVSSTLPPRAR